MVEQKSCMMIAFEYMDRRSLKDLLHKNGPLPEAVMSVGCKHVCTLSAAQSNPNGSYLFQSFRFILSQSELT